MAWAVELSEEADRELGKLDGQHRKRILKFLYQRVAKLDNPRSLRSQSVRCHEESAGAERRHAIAQTGRSGQPSIKSREPRRGDTILRASPLTTW